VGRTVPSYRQALEDEIGRWEGFKKALRGKDVEAFEALMKACREYASAGGNASRPILSEAMFMCILLSLQRQLMDVREKLESLERRIGQHGR
jgi:hypothetical protein